MLPRWLPFFWLFILLTTQVPAMLRHDSAANRSDANSGKALISNGDGVVAYYGYRYYEALNGRWTNRDPIGERGGVNHHKTEN